MSAITKSRMLRDQRRSLVLAGDTQSSISRRSWQWPESGWVKKTPVVGADWEEWGKGPMEKGDCQETRREEISCKYKEV